MSGPTTPTLDQRRAKHAWNTVQDVLRKHPKQSDAAKKFGGQARKLPTRVIASGLGQALAFLRAKNYAPDLLAALDHWVLRERAPADGGAKKVDTLLQAVIEGSADDLRR